MTPMAGTSSILICSVTVLPLPPNQAELRLVYPTYSVGTLRATPCKANLPFALPAGRLPLDRPLLPVKGVRFAPTVKR